MKISSDYEVLLALLRSSLRNDPCEGSFNYSLTSREWQNLFNNSVRQGVMALAFDALPKGELLPGISKELLITWGLSVRRIETRNRRQREALKEMIALFRRNGIELLLLKGLGLAENYPLPGHRECGDIDIYLFGDYEKGNKIIENLGIEVNRDYPKHSAFRFKGIPVENHVSFLNLDFPKSNKNLERQLHQILDREGYDTVFIDDFEFKIPTPDFTALFLILHNITHFLDTGLILRQLSDLALFFCHNSNRIDFELLKKTLSVEKYYDLFCSFMDLAYQYLDMPMDSVPVTVHDPILKERIMDDALNNISRKIGKKELLNMWVPRRKVIGTINLFSSKWKYDLLGQGEFYSRFTRSVKALF